MRKASSSYIVFAVMIVLTMLLSACQTKEVVKTVEVEKVVQQTVEVEKVVQQTVQVEKVVQQTVQVEKVVQQTVEVAVTPTPVPPTATSAPVQIGTADNPIIMALAPSATSQDLQTGGQAIADKLAELTGYTIKINVPTNYAALVEAMGSGNAHIGWLPPLAYMLAKYKGYADVGLVVLRSGSDHYGFQYVTNAARKDADGKLMFTSFYDATTGKSTADAATALAQFAGKKPCWTDPLSASGYVLPSGLLAKVGIKVKSGAWVQGHPTVITSVYLSPNGEICDFGATYIDARTAVAKTFPDVNDKVQIIYISDPIIPNDNVSFASNVPADVRQKLIDGLVQLASTEDGLTLLKNGGYDIGGLKPVDDTFYDDFRAYLDAAGYDVTNFK
jgi:phosphonate transport system substrate-binding protein